LADRTLDQFAEDLRTESGGKLRARINTLMKNLSTRTAREAKKNLARKIHSRTGALAGSVGGSALAGPEGIGVEIRAGGFSSKGQPVPYARVHELGAIIRAKKGRYLAIPIGPARTKGGASKYPSPRMVGGLAFGLSKKTGKAYLFKVGDEGPPWFRLKEQVKIPKRPYLRPAIEKLRREMPNELQPLVRASVLNMPSPKAS
jgi:hypothetical protein